MWASKWNERAVLSLRRAGLSHAALQMAVLCQEVVPAAYAFVAHTRHPTTGVSLQVLLWRWRQCTDVTGETRDHHFRIARGYSTRIPTLLSSV